jgi:hypothetical protein
MQVKPVMVSPSELWEGIDRYYRRELIETVTEIEADPPSVTPVVTAGTEELAKHWTLPEEEGGASSPSAQTPSPEPIPEQALNATAAVAAPAPEQAQDPGEITQPVVEVAPRPPASNVPEAAPRAAAPAVSAEEKSRIIFEALTQILIEKGVMSRDELQQRIRALVQAQSERG